MKIESRLTHYITQAMAAISAAIWKDIEFHDSSDLYATISSLDVEQKDLEREIRKWGVAPAPFIVTADLNVFNQHDDMTDGGEYECDFWGGMKYEVVLNFIGDSMGKFVAEVKRIEPTPVPVKRVTREHDPIAEIMADPKIEIEEAL